MIQQFNQNEAKRVRYTLLLTPSELELARKLARQEFRTLPDFFRARIYNPPPPNTGGERT